MGAGRPEPAGLFGKAVGLSSPSHASLLQDMRGFAPRIAVGSLSSHPLGTPHFPHPADCGLSQLPCHAI